MATKKKFNTPHLPQKTFHLYLFCVFEKVNSKRTYIIYKNKNNRLKYRKCVQEEEKQNKRKG